MGVVRTGLRLTRLANQHWQSKLPQTHLKPGRSLNQTFVSGDEPEAKHTERLSVEAILPRKLDKRQAVLVWSPTR